MLFALNGVGYHVGELMITTQVWITRKRSPKKLLYFFSIDFYCVGWSGSSGIISSLTNFKSVGAF